jgi:hypothetical protein
MKFKHIIWLPFDISQKYIDMAKKHGMATNQLQAMILAKAIEDICSNCELPKLACLCTYITCRQCNQQFLKGKGFTDRFCSSECAKAWYYS